MKSGAKRKTFENIIIGILYFVIFSFTITGVGMMSEKVFLNPTILNVTLYIIGIIAVIATLILFINAWEDTFESEDHPKG